MSADQNLIRAIAEGESAAAHDEDLDVDYSEDWVMLGVYCAAYHRIRRLMGATA